MTAASQIIANKALVIPIAAWVAAQILKTIIEALRERHVDLHYLVSAGGMPSAHASVVCALATTAGIVYGLQSPLFAITIILAGIVMYDAAGVRQAVDKQSVILDHLLIEFPKTHLEFEQFLQQLVGHNRFQVLAGALLGFLIAYWWA